MSNLNLFNRKFIFILAFIFLAELFSLFGHLLPDFNKIAFLIIILLTIIASLIKLEYGLWILFAELFIGSKGYLFFFEQDGLVISIRIALWLVVMAVWSGGVVSEWMKKAGKDTECPTRLAEVKGEAQVGHLVSNNQWFYFFILFLFIAWGVINGFLNYNEFNNIFFDFNGWLYFALVFPVYSVFKKNDFVIPVPPKAGGIQSQRAKSWIPAFAGMTKEKTGMTKENTGMTKEKTGMTSAAQLILPVNTILQIFTASIIWLSAKTFFLLFAFSHNMMSITSELYRWVRVSGVGEITQMQGGFYRIFFQSHIFVLIGFFVFILLLSQAINKKDKLDRKFTAYYLLLITILFSTILISFSRSFWAGLIIGFVFLCFCVFVLYGWKKFIITNAILLCAGIFSIGLITAVVKFPYPQPLGGFVTAELLSGRAGQITGEAGVSSRWALLPELWNKIKQAPVLGQGFGATITYQSSDPRVLQSSPAGEYTTYAFEWGWLDVWLKLGFLGMIVYLVLIGKICVSGFKQSSQNKIVLGLIIGLIVISVVSIFSPYMNHPLGIGYLILVSAMFSRNA